jgi:hypothetical protein
MSKAVKLTQSDIEKIVKNVINEQSNDIADHPTNIDEQGDGDGELDVDYEIGGSPDNSKDHLDIFLGKKEGSDEIYVINARTGQILGHRRP